MMLCGFSVAFSQSTVQGYVLLQQDSTAVYKAKVTFIHPDGQYKDSAFTDAQGFYQINNVFVGIHSPFASHVPGMQVVPNPARDHNIYVREQQDVNNIDIYNLQGQHVKTLPINKRADGIGYAHWNAEVPTGVYIASYGDVARKIVHNNNGPESQRQTAVPQAVKEQMDKNSKDTKSTKDNYNVTVEEVAGQSNVLFAPQQAQENVVDGVNTRNFTVMPSSYRHHYFIETSHPAHVTVHAGANNLFDDSVNATAQTDSMYAGETEQVSIIASAPGKMTLDTMMTLHWNGDTIPVNLKDSTYTYILQGSSPDSVNYEFWNKNETTQLATGIANNGYKDTVKTTTTLDSMLVKMHKQGRVDKDTIIGVAQGANTFDMPELDLEYVIKASGSADNASVKLVYDGDTIATGTIDTTQTPDWQATIVREPGKAMDTVEVVQDKQGRARTISEHAVQPGQNSIQLPAMNYENDMIFGSIGRNNVGGGGNNIHSATVSIYGLNINHKDTITMKNIGGYVFYDVPIPADPQGNADTALYERTILPTDTSSTQMFKEYTDTIFVTPNTNSLGQVYVQELDQNQSIKGTITDIYDNTTTLDSTNVIFRKKADSTIIAQDVTGANGEYELHNIPCNTQGFFQVGYYTTNAGYLSREGHEYTTQAEIIQPKDSSATVNWTLVPDSLELPATPNDPNHGTKIPAIPSKIKDLIRGPPFSGSYYMDAEEASGRQVQLNYGSMTLPQQQAFELFIILAGDSLFYGISKDVPINDPSRPFKLVTYNLDANHYNNNYHPIDNYHADSLGWNVSHGGNTTYASGNTSFDNGKQYPEYATNGGSIYVDLSDQAGNIKEIYGRSEKRMDVTGYPSFMNLNAAMPTLQDRAVIYLIHENEKKRLGENSIDYYPLDKTTYTISTYP